MAEPENVESIEQSTEETRSDKKSGGKLMALAIPIAAALVFAGGGFFVGRTFGTRGNAQNVAAAEKPATKEKPAQQTTTEIGGEPAWFFDMESIVANLNEPGGSRYVRIGLTLGIGEELKEKDGTPMLEKKMPMLMDWLTLYMTNQSISDIQGEARLRVMKEEIAQAFNKGLFGDGPGHIKKVYVKELSIQ